MEKKSNKCKSPKRNLKKSDADAIAIVGHCGVASRPWNNRSRPRPNQPDVLFAFNQLQTLLDMLVDLNSLVALKVLQAACCTLKQLFNINVNVWVCPQSSTALYALTDQPVTICTIHSWSTGRLSFCCAIFRLFCFLQGSSTQIKKGF